MDQQNRIARPRSGADEPPFRDELLPPERLADRAREEAHGQRSTTTRSLRPTRIGALLDRADADLQRTNLALARAVRSGRAVSPSVEWLLDNYYLIDEQVRAARGDLPPGYGAELPRLIEGPDKGFPRIWRAMIVLVAHTDSRIDEEVLERFVAAYQDVAPLSIGETWAVPIVLRIALVENLRRLAARIVAELDAERAAENWADRLITALDESAESGSALLADLEKEPAIARSPAVFFVRLSQRLADQDRDIASVSRRIDREVERLGATYEQVVTNEHQRRAADQVSIANAVTSIRFVEASDWRGFFERINLVEQTLRTDPAGVYAAMDFKSRDRYRHALEALAKRCPDSELDIARKVVARADEAMRADVTDLIEGHVGWYLISEGRYEFEESLRYTASRRERRHRGWMSRRATLYIGMLVLVMLAGAAALSAYAIGHGASPWAAAALALLSLVPFSSVAVDVANRTAAAIWPPRALPKLDFSQPVSPAHRTLVVVPALLTSPGAVEHTLANIEIHLLANTDDNIHFALLGDLKAAGAEHADADEAILRAAQEGVATLNERYPRAGGGPFHLFARSRRFNAEEGVWMGWERKRGALTELNRFLRGATDTSITCYRGDASFLPGVTFAITLDSDTILPRDAARGLISTIAHPLNRARIDERDRIVTRGYGLVQPRVGMTLVSATATPYAELNAGASGIDPYSGSVSDTYQDVFGEGSFTGKGIYEVDVFNTVLEGRFPENALLSHDLMEGNFLRTALASDIEVLDDYPPDYATQCSRVHRWTRGDWQTLPWLGSTVPDESGKRYHNPLRPLHRFKILDNLRRSIAPASIIVFAIAGWLVLPETGWAWPTGLVLLVVYPALMHATDAVIGAPSGVGLAGTLRPLLADLAEDLTRAVTTIALLPHQALLLLDAGIRALWRSRVSHRRMLEWTTAAEAQASSGSDLPSFVRLMGPAAALALVLAAVPFWLVHDSRWFIGVGALLWVLSPAIAWRMSRPFHRQPQDVPTTAQIASLRRLARRTWRFFEHFVSDEDHWLPPDNYQEDPKGEIAHRTSPTNMGLALIANLTAHDLGYITVSGLVERVTRTLETMAGLERFRGHFYNWYDTVSLAPLRPAYVSTVDSGNLAGHLLALRTGLDDAAHAPIVGAQVLDGAADALRLALEDLRDAREGATPAAEADRLRRDVDEVLRRVTLAERPRSLGAWAAMLGELVRLAEGLPERARSLGGSGSPQAASVRDAVEALRRPLSEIERYAPWASLASSVPAAVPERGGALAPVLAAVPSLTDLARGLDPTLAALDELAETPAGTDDVERAAVAAWASALATGIREARKPCGDLHARLELMRAIATEMWDHADFQMLYDEPRELFSIGFNTEQGRLDDSYYDMLASECRLASYLAVARGEVSQEHCFRLGRQLTRTAGTFALLSWSASMFEYLMPLLVMRTYPDTLLDRTYRAVVKRQIEYGAERKVPWGVSESAFNAKDAELTYQYQAFGVPGLGLKRGLSDDVVVAPYATMLAIPVDRAAALENLDRLASEGAFGHYGFFEALDYTPGRVPAGARRAIVKTYMAHHQGMGFVAIGNELTGHAMQRRFHDDPLVASAELLLQERVPRHIKPAQPHVEEVEFVRSLRETPPPVNRSYPLADTPTPATHFLSNGRYSVMVTNAGGGYSRWGDFAVSRYREDLTRDCWGQFVFLRDVSSGRSWSSTHQPTLVEADDYHCILSADRAEYRRRDGEIETYTEVVVSPEDDVEIRRVALTNHGRAKVVLEVTSYFEVSLAPQGADQAHRAFSNLFVETEAVAPLSTLLFTRRPRSDEEERHWGLHTLACESAEPCEWSYETDRARFVGRLNQVHAATAARTAGPLSGTVGAVLDPVCSIRTRVTIGPGETVRVAFATGVAATREAALSCAEKYHDIRSAQRAIDLAWGTSEIELRDLGITPEDAVVFQRLASRLLLTDPFSRLKRKTKQETTLPMSGLWGLGISGDHPIMLVRIERMEDAPFVRQCLLAHQYWRHKGFVSDLVVLNTKPSAYSSPLEDKLRMLVRTGHALQLMDKPGGVFLRNADQMAPEVLNLLESVARATLDADAGPVSLQLNRRAVRPASPDPFVPRMPVAPEDDAPPFVRPDLAFDNGYGGVDQATGEYVIVLEDGLTTPAPWVNVMAMPEFGTMITEAGVGCTWALNSHENRLTTWNNDPVSDGSGEILYIRDEATGEVWSPTPLPVQDDAPYVIRHGRGYSVFEHACHGIEHTLTWFVPVADPIRIATLRLHNPGDAARDLSVTQFVEWVLGDSRSRANQRVVTAYDTEGRMLTAHSHFNPDFPGRVAFMACDRKLQSFTADRTEFLGRNGTPAAPAAMGRKELGGQVGRFHDTCGALMTTMTIAPGETIEVRFLLGQTDTLDEARELTARYRQPTAAAEALAAVRSHWNGLLDTLRVVTPDPAFDEMANGRALYQALSCRIWGRTALYQSSGAFGFRDQLQDVMALTLARPDIARAQIVEASRHQFEEGDVLHWWQPHSGRGVRTHFTDDRNWLPFVTADYIEATGDVSVLRESTPFIAAPPVAEGREDDYVVPAVTLTEATVYEHCIRALERSRGTGPHGLPLMGGGDWNDGMNRVGIGGSGESVWMAWFLNLTLKRFAPVCESMGDADRATEYRAWADELAATVEREAWDGAWYRRAYFDDGTPLGTHEAQECRIDAIAQAWAVISGAAEPTRALRALESVEEKLVRWEDGLIALLSPPFDHMAKDPGYIKGYVPGVRENGGQYTHAALWVVMAYAMLGDGDEAVALLDLINPLTHARTREAADVYRVEPYSVAADVYAVAPHTGRGGWTWYTGSASWFHTVATRSILGIRPLAEEDGTRSLVIDPCIPKSWPTFGAELRIGTTIWRITVENPRGVNRGVERITLDGSPAPRGRVPLIEDGGEHTVVVAMLGG
ncbi:MAG: glucoamylase family protein [Coriobacteriia bacterium]|nr:glucoamylase family protein [Coriobacteriia bacterium]